MESQQTASGLPSTLAEAMEVVSNSRKSIDDCESCTQQLRQSYEPQGWSPSGPLGVVPSVRVNTQGPVLRPTGVDAPSAVLDVPALFFSGAHGATVDYDRMEAYKVII